MKDAVRLEVRKWIEVAREFYPNYNIPMPSVVFSERMTSAGGRCSWNPSENHYTLKFSLDIMRRNDITEFMERTVPHEVAHIVQHSVYKDMNHGSTFDYVMRTVFHRTAKQSSRCHSYDTVKKEKMLKGKGFYRYVCPTCKNIVMLTEIRHWRVQRGMKAYVDKASHGRLVYCPEDK